MALAELAEMKRSCAETSRDHDRVQANIEINYELESWEGSADLGSDALENALFNENIDLEGWTFVSVKSNGYQDPAYSNFLSAPQGSIVCFNDDKSEDHNAPESRLEWSDIIFQVYQMEAAKRLQVLRGLRTIWRFDTREHLLSTRKPTLYLPRDEIDDTADVAPSYLYDIRSLSRTRQRLYR